MKVPFVVREMENCRRDLVTPSVTVASEEGIGRHDRRGACHLYIFEAAKCDMACLHSCCEQFFRMRL